LLAPSLEGAAESSHLWDWARREAGDHLLREPPAFGGVDVINAAQLLVALPGQVNIAVGVAGLQMHCIGVWRAALIVTPRDAKV
jgi:hypothetical protein